MVRLPTPGGDKGDWGEILNSFLEVSLNPDGTLKGSAIGATGPQGNSITGSTGATGPAGSRQQFLAASWLKGPIILSTTIIL